MKAVVQAILLDPEAREDDIPGSSDELTSTPTTGLMRDSVLWWASILRSAGATQNLPWPWDGEYDQVFDIWLSNMLEAPHQEPSVFSFYSPTNMLPGTELYAPEFELENTETLSWMILHAQDLMNNNLYVGKPKEFTFSLGPNNELVALASYEGPTALVDALSALFLHGTMTTDMRDSIVQAVQGLDATTMVKNAMFLVVTSPQYRIMI
jgi:hypothetical protein